MNETWSCCGHDLIGLCRTAGCGIPDHCFFCGKPRHPPDPVPESQPTRDELMASIQAYAEEWKAGKSTMHSGAKIRLITALDRHEFSLIDRMVHRVAQALLTVTRLG